MSVVIAQEDLNSVCWLGIVCTAPTVYSKNLQTIAEYETLLHP